MLTTSPPRQILEDDVLARRAIREILTVAQNQELFNRDELASAVRSLAESALHRFEEESTQI